MRGKRNEVEPLPDQTEKWAEVLVEAGKRHKVEIDPVAGERVLAELLKLSKARLIPETVASRALQEAGIVYDNNHAKYLALYRAAKRFREAEKARDTLSPEDFEKIKKLAEHDPVFVRARVETQEMLEREANA